ncbi:MAG: LysM peptidoglycan-binding domain-containing M23 family metallopeptidase, partial [Deltaproteobacteria bacterium]
GIAHAYGVDLQDLAEANNIKDHTQIKKGQRLFIPRVRPDPLSERVPRSGVGRTRKADKSRPSPPLKSRKVVVEKGKFAWPVKGTVVSPYGMRNDVMHQGIDIAAPRNTPILASESGTVVYANNGMKGYGNVVILKHAGDFYTVYAHNEKNLVKAGEKVKKSSAIALVGDTGNAEAYHVHFEVRQGKKTGNPLFFLP